jgi:hypothetical protein
MNAYCLCISHKWLLLSCVGKYYLVDAGYPPLMKGYLTPYKGERYHLPHFQRVGQGNGIKESEKRYAGAKHTICEIKRYQSTNSQSPNMKNQIQ